MAKKSAAILMYKRVGERLEVLLVHPGGPFWQGKDAGAWSLPKGEFEQDEDPLGAAKREFLEETGFPIVGKFVALTPIRQPSRKLIHAWAVEGDCDASAIVSNTFTMEWPPRSGHRQEFPEVDRADWFPIDVASRKLLKGQRGFVEQLLAFLGHG